MVEFSASAVMAMLALVEATLVVTYVYLGRKKADDEDVEDVEDELDDVDEKAGRALREIRDVEREVEAVTRRVEEAVATDGGPEHDPEHD